jgi:hypothetical protein
MYKYVRYTQVKRRCRIELKVDKDPSFDSLTEANIKILYKICTGYTVK